MVGTQGKYDVDSNGLVHGYNLPRVMSIVDLEKCMTDRVCSSASLGNDTDAKFSMISMTQIHDIDRSDNKCAER